jgi:hypothetical protein
MAKLTLVVDNTTKHHNTIEITNSIKYSPPSNGFIAKALEHQREALYKPLKGDEDKLMVNVMKRIADNPDIPEGPEDGYYWDEPNARVRKVEGHPRWDPVLKNPAVPDKPKSNRPLLMRILVSLLAFAITYYFMKG